MGKLKSDVSVAMEDVAATFCDSSVTVMVVVDEEIPAVSGRREEEIEEAIAAMVSSFSPERLLLASA